MKILSLLFIMVLLFVGTAVQAQPANTAIMVKGVQTVEGVKTFGGGLNTSAGTVVKLGNVSLQWMSLNANVSVEASGTNHGLIVHTSGVQGNAIIGFSESGAAGTKVWQKVTAVSPSLIVGRDELTTPTTVSLVYAVQSVNSTGPLLELKGSTNQQFYVLDNGQPVIATSSPSTSTSTGTAGQIAWDASYLYICIATDTWRRISIPGTTW